VIFKKYAGTDVTMGGIKYFIISTDDVLRILIEEAEQYE